MLCEILPRIRTSGIALKGHWCNPHLAMKQTRRLSSTLEVGDSLNGWQIDKDIISHIPSPSAPISQHRSLLCTFACSGKPNRTWIRRADCIHDDDGKGAAEFLLQCGLRRRCILALASICERWLAALQHLHRCTNQETVPLDSDSEIIRREGGKEEQMLFQQSLQRSQLQCDLYGLPKRLCIASTPD